MTDRGVPPTRISSGLYKVVVELEEPRRQNGESQTRRLIAYRNQPRGTAEHLAKLCMRDGVRLDAIEGTRFISPFRVLETRIMRDEEDWT